ncbi:MAG: cyanophycin synthetase [Candidatus Pacebacteria bacterium]|nr:cyanophycin synthetase [Candidatus Paceibacterota bacterium]MBP9840042.1 cyanophycin synthetase [Candidatus Paceibacterota bacterium]
MKHLPFVSALFKKLAKRAGVTVNLEPGYGFAGQIVTKDGRKRYFRGTKLDINTLGATETSADKDFAAHFMREMGYPVPEGEAFFSDAWAKMLKSKRTIDAAYRYAQKLGFPVIVKPNSKSRGIGVVKAANKADFYRAFRAAAKADTVVLVQEPCLGRDYRVVVLDGRIISAYERLPLTVVGDGKSTVRALLQKLQERFEREGRDTRINIKDWRIARKLARQKLTFDSVLPRTIRAALLDNANLSSGGMSVDVTNDVHPGFANIAVRLTRDMGLRLCGVDLMIDGDIRRPPSEQDYAVLEINSAPGLDHYASQGRKQQRIVEDLYLELLKSMSA